MRSAHRSHLCLAVSRMLAAVMAAAVFMVSGAAAASADAVESPHFSMTGTPYPDPDTVYAQSESAQDTVRVLSYNVAHWNNDGDVYIGDSGNEEALLHLKLLLMRVEADVVCTQEDGEFIDAHGTLSPLESIFAPLYPYKTGVGGPAIYSKSTDGSRTFVLSTCTIRRTICTVNGKSLYVYCAHLDSGSADIRIAQLNDIIANAIGEDRPAHWVVCGDFNTMTSADMHNLIALASTNDYSFANGGVFGWLDTNKIGMPLDNFLCSPNIIIIKFEAMEDWHEMLWSDHYPVYCDLILQ
ncbi:MAG: endonuclease/exonuclease/phosphatase family protein [Clostridia bacterium]|nr:endonuclease/exonuclease/phosphatase family protein [Clostridia bacterium]